MNILKTENKELLLALSNFKCEDHGIVLDVDVKVQGPDGRTYNFSYASLKEIETKVLPFLKKHGLMYIQTVSTGCSVHTTLFHIPSGEYIESASSFPLEPNHSYQSYGQAITYLKRYALVAMLGLKAESDDDANNSDGNKASFKVNGKPKLDEDRFRTMVSFITAGKVADVEKSINKYDLTDTQKTALTSMINAKKAELTKKEAGV